MKRLTVLCALLFALTACGQSAPTDTSTDTSNTDTSSSNGSGTVDDPYTGYDAYYRLLDGRVVDCITDGSTVVCDWR